jgi:hypothetical protein
MEVQNPYYVYVNSRERETGTDSDFTYNIQFPTDVNIANSFTHVVCLDVLIPKSYYLIQNTTPLDNIFQLKENNTIVTITIPIGNYLLTAFSKTVSALLTAASPNNLTYTMTYPSPVNGADIGKWFYGQNNAAIQSSIITNTHLFEPLGFLSNTINAFNGTQLISTAVIKLQSEDRLLLQSNLVQNGRDSILVSINSSTNVNYSSIAWQCPQPEYWSHKLSSSLINTYSFQLTDEDSENINLNGLNLNFTLLFYRYDLNENIKNFMKMFIEEKK